MRATHSNKLECWLYKEPKQYTCRTEKDSSKVTTHNSKPVTANIFRVPLKEIHYVTTFNVKKGFLKFVTEDGAEYYRRLSLKEIVNANDNFIFIRKDTVVNVSHVTKRCDWLYLWIDKNQFDISRQYRKEVKERFESFVL